MPLSPNDFYHYALAAADDERRMPLSRMTAWQIFPFEPHGLRVVSLQSPSLPESARRGEHGSACPACEDAVRGVIWEDAHWRLSTFAEPSGAPLVVMLQPKAHFDLPNLPDDLAREFGVLIVHVARAIESLAHIARAHVARWGDGGAHLHVFFFARPEGFEQLRGTCFAIWDDLLPPTPRDIRDADARSVARALSSTFGGEAVEN